ncbi:MAG TPA: hypothetical protein VHV75_07065 [Solirubrobacteraceae bacterium]|jgi:hypothetical protein|nr:hypothetical protein [Solirubrobacteraceae bacterium]
MNGTAGSSDDLDYYGTSSCAVPGGSVTAYLDTGISPSATGLYESPTWVIWGDNALFVVSSTSSVAINVSLDSSYTSSQGCSSGGTGNSTGWPLTQKTNDQLGLPSSIPNGSITISTTP